MSEHETIEAAPEDNSPDPVSSVVKGRQAFNKITRELTDKELSNAAVQRLLLDELDRLEIENEEKKEIQLKFHETDKKVSLLEQKNKVNIGFEILSSASLTIGAAALGYAPMLWQHQPSGYITLVFGGVLIVVGVVAKVLKQ